MTGAQRTGTSQGASLLEVNLAKDDPMKRRPLTFVFVVVTAAFLSTLALAAGIDDLRAAAQAADKGDWTECERRADAAINSGDLRDSAVGYAYYLRGLGRWLKKDANFERALDDLTAALRHLDHGSELWAEVLSNRIYLQMNLGRWVEAANDFLTLAKVVPAAARSVRFRPLSRILWKLEDKDEAKTLEVLRAMRAINYEPKGPGDDMDGIVAIYVRLLVKAGETATAVQELARIVDTGALVQARVDRRYQALWSMPAFEAATNPAEIAKRQVVSWEGRYQKSPNFTPVVTRYVVALRIAGEFEKAVSVARLALGDVSKLKTDGDGDGDGDVLWLRNELVYALKDLGRTDEMFAEMEPVFQIDPDENGHVVSQLINFGELMMEMGRGDDAVKTSKRAWEQASVFGRMFIQAIEVCAKATSDRRGSERVLVELRKSEAENYGAVSQALLCLEKTDEAAELVKKRLSAPASRGDIITAAQNYEAAPFVTPIRRQLLERFKVVLARPDVRSEFDKHGRIETFPFKSEYWGNL